MAAGEMPALAELRGRSARFRLDHGPAQRTGLAWEHVASGLSPERGTSLGGSGVRSGHVRGVAGGRSVRSVVGRPRPAGRRVRHALRGPAAARRTRGVSSAGAPTIPESRSGACPHGLLAEFETPVRRLSRRPSGRTAVPFPSAARTQAMGEALSGALDVRSRAARWLATERLPDWDLFIAVAGEAPRRDRRPMARPRPEPSAPRASLGGGRGPGIDRVAPGPRSHGRRARLRRRRRGDRRVHHGRHGTEPLRRPIHGPSAGAPLPPRLRSAAAHRAAGVERQRRAACRSWRKRSGWARASRAWVPEPPQKPEPSLFRSFSRSRDGCQGRSRPCSRRFAAASGERARRGEPAGSTGPPLAAGPALPTITGLECRHSRCPRSTTDASASISGDASATAWSSRRDTRRRARSSRRCSANVETRAPASPSWIPSSARRHETPSR